MTMEHIMLDLETFGTAPGCAMRSIGAVAFDPHSDGCGQEFYANIEKQSCVDVGLHIDPKTERWWAEQSVAAQKALEEDQVPLAEAVSGFNKWFRAAGGVYVWSQGANFDVVLIEAAMKAVKAFVPWKFWNARDTRTVYHMFGFDDKSLPREGVHHNALNDAKHQAACVQTAMRRRPIMPDGLVA